MKKYSILLFFILVLILFHKFGYIGHYGYDDLEYAKMAYDLLQSNVDYDNHFSYRIPTVLLTALSYSIFGVSDLASALPPLITSALILLILFLILKNKDSKTIIIALSLTTFSTWFIFWADKLSCDIYVALFAFAALAILHKFKYNSPKKPIFLFALIFATLLFFGFLAKETIILILPLLLYIFIWDIIHKQDCKFWIYSMLCGITLLLCYFFVIWLLTGNFLNRFDAIINNSYLNLCSYDQQSLKILFKRIAWDFLNMCVYQNIIIGFVFVLAFFFQKNILSYFKLKNSFSFFFVSSVFLILSCNFMSISFTSYSPMCIDPRHYLFLIPIVSIPASEIINQFIREKKHAIPIIIILLGVSVISFFSQSNIFSTLYLPVTLLFFAYIFLKPKHIYQQIFVAVFVMILFLQPLNLFKYAQSVQYGKQKENLFKHIINKNEECYVITNEVQKRLGEYYTGFNPNSPIKFITYDELKDNTNTDRKKILLKNNYTLYLSGLNESDLPFYVRNAPLSNKLLFEDKKIAIYIYEMTNLSLVNLDDYTIFYTINDFENPVLYWSLNDIFSTDIKYEGKQSNQFLEYSCTFVFPLDSLHFEEDEKLIVSCNLYCYFDSETNSQIVVSVENEDGTYIWQGFGVNRFIRAYSNWWLAKCEATINSNEIKSNSILKIYVWNKDNRNGFIDNFEIELIKIPAF